MQDRRAQPRHGVRIEGKLMSPDMTLCVDVVIRNLSEDGALVNVLAPAESLPESVYLWQAQTRTLFECTVQWRKHERMVGLRFTDTCSRVSLRRLLDAAVPAQALARSGSHAPTVVMRYAG